MKLSNTDVRMIRTLLVRRPNNVKKMEYYRMLSQLFSVHWTTITDISRDVSHRKVYGMAR